MICHINAIRMFNCLVIQLFFILNLTVKAEVVMDKSFENDRTIQPVNNTYIIDANDGRQEGQNLFHSFKSFNIEKGMTADFTGPSTIQRIISRVTGGEISHIDGTIKSSIPGADLFLLNPNGFIFGASALLDIDGSLYVSTADYLQMTESEKLMTGSTATSGFVSSPPHSFGFLDENVAPILFQGPESIEQGHIDETYETFIDNTFIDSMNSGTIVKGNHDFCIIGGQITIEKGVRIYLADQTNQNQMNDTKGAIQLVSIKSKANVDLNNMIAYSQDTKYGNISIKGSILNTSGKRVGGINILGEDIIVENSIFYLDNFGEFEASPVNISGNKIIFQDYAKIISDTYANGNAAPIHLNAKSDIFFKERFAAIYSFSYQAQKTDAKISGNTSQMSIVAKNLYLQDGSRILSRTHGFGNCSDISIQAAESISLSSKKINYNECSIFFDTYGPGSAGTIYLEAKNIEFANGAKLSVSTLKTGSGGSITINAEEFHLKGIRYNEQLKVPRQGSRIFVRSYGEGTDAGSSGDLFIHAKNIIMDDGAQIKAQTYGFGKGGDITLIATEKIELKGHDGKKNPAMINASCDRKLFDSGTQQTGNVTLISKNIILKDGAWISTHTDGNGDSGKIDIKATQKLELSGESQYRENIDKDKLSSCILSSARPKSKGNGGKIIINANEILLSDGAFIETGTESSGNAGTIDINANTITLMKTSSDNKSSMIESNSQAKLLDSRTHTTGCGGKISIEANNINLFDGARISTSSIADTKSSGDAGDIRVNMNGTLRISGQNSKDRESSGIYAQSEQNNAALAGKAGNIAIIANNIVMDNHGLITTSSNGLKNAGDIEIQTKQSILLTHSKIVSESTMPVTSDQNGGAAGSISIKSGNDIQLFQSAHISTNAVSSGGGKIYIQNQNALTIINSDITTNVRHGVGNGGDINIRSNLTVMNHGIISANADAGDGGAIYINTRHLIQSTDSRIEATSKRGNNGTVEIETPDVEENQNLLNLSDNFLNTVSIVNTLCDQSNAQESIKFIVHAPYMPNLSASWFKLSANTSASLLPTNITDQFDHFSADFSDDNLYQIEE